jgi:restriction system protein
MAIPDYQSIFLPLLKLAGSGGEVSLAEAKDELAKQFRLSEEDRKALLPSGRQFLFDNRVGWARTYLKKAGLIEYVGKGYFRITDRGKEVLGENPDKLNVKYLKRYPEFLEFATAKKKSKERSEKVTMDDETDAITPEEKLEYSYQSIRDELAQELIKQVKSCSPAFFERLVVELLVNMGYGGSRKDAGEAIGRGGDGGIDGVIKEDRLGLDAIYIQAKRWEGTVGSPEIQKFIGALEGRKSKKGIFITTSSFTKDAEKFASSVSSKVVLIDGETLAQYMIDFNIGVSRVATYEIKKVDVDYFTEE